MSDYYTEQMIKKQTGMKDVLIKAILVAFTIVSVLLVFMIPLGLIVAVIMIAIDVFVFRQLNIEYEYLFVNGDLDIDKIMNRSKRKRVFSVNVSEMELLAPIGAVELRQYQNARTCNYSSGTTKEGLYALVAADKGELKKIIFEPNETIVEGFFMMAPRKVIRK